MVRALLLAGVVLTAGCASGSPPVATPPVDFVLDAAVVGPADTADVAPPAVGWIGHRYILFADGTLHHDVGEPTASGHVPPARRVLTRKEMAELWRTTEACGLTDPEAAGRLDHLQAAGDGDAAVVVLLGAQGQWWSHRQRFDGAEPDVAPPAMRLIGRLAELAWAGEFDRRAIVAPKRYDFGPDPYARFR